MVGKKRPGGPIKHDAATLRTVFLKGVRLGASISAGARSAGVSFGTARRWLDKDPTLLEEYRRTKQEAMDAGYRRHGGMAVPFREKQTAPKGRSRTKRPGLWKLTPERLEALLEGIRTAGTAREGALRAGVTERTVTRWRKDRKVARLMDMAVDEYDRKQAKERAAAMEGWTDGLEARMDLWLGMEADPEAPQALLNGTSVAAMRREPGLFFERVLGWEPWSKQMEIAEAVAEALGGGEGIGIHGEAQRRGGEAAEGDAVREGRTGVSC